MKTTFEERFFEAWENLDTLTRYQLHWAYATEYGDDAIYPMDEFNELESGREPLDLALMIRFGDFNPNHEYFRYNGYGNLVSAATLAEWLDDAVVSDMADWYERNQHTMQWECPELLYLYDEDEEEEDEEEEEE